MRRSVNETSKGLASREQLHVTSEFFVKATKKYFPQKTKGNSKKLCGHASYAFLKAYEIMGTVSFLVENSEIELTNSDGIRVLKNYEIVATAVQFFMRIKFNSRQR